MFRDVILQATRSGASMNIRLHEMLQTFVEALPFALLDQGPMTLGRHRAYSGKSRSGDWRVTLALHVGCVCAKIVGREITSMAGVIAVDMKTKTVTVKGPRGAKWTSSWKTRTG